MPLTGRGGRGVVLVLALALPLLPHGAGDGVAAAQAVLADLLQGDVDVVRAGEVAGGPHEAVVVEDVEDAADGMRTSSSLTIGSASMP
jgi:hypothetical protein